MFLASCIVQLKLVQRRLDQGNDAQCLAEYNELQSDIATTYGMVWYGMVWYGMGMISSNDMQITTIYRR